MSGASAANPTFHALSGFEEHERPPLPDRVRILPRELFVRETVWWHWQGSPEEIARLAIRAEKRLRWYFTSWDEPRWWKAERAWRKMAPHTPYGQDSIVHRHSVTTKFWSGGTTSAEMRDEIAARRSAVQIIQIRSTASVRLWPQDVFERVPLRQIPKPEPLPPGVHTTISTVDIPQLIEIEFQRAFPAVRLRVIARDANVCQHLHDHFAPHVEGGARPRAWEPETGACVGALVGAGMPDVLLLTGTIAPWTTMLMQFGLAAVGWFIGVGVVRWMFPPLELLEAF